MKKKKSSPNGFEQNAAWRELSRSSCCLMDKYYRDTESVSVKPMKSKNKSGKYRLRAIDACSLNSVWVKKKRRSGHSPGAVAGYKLRSVPK